MNSVNARKYICMCIPTHKHKTVHIFYPSSQTHTAKVSLGETTDLSLVYLRQRTNLFSVD